MSTNTTSSSAPAAAFNTYFGGLKLTKVRQDCTNLDILNPYLQTCSVPKVCQPNCFSCSSATNCTACVGGYFLYNKNGVFECLRCPLTLYADIFS